MIVPTFDTYDFLQRGWAAGRIPDLVADSLVRQLSRTPFIPLPSDHCDAGPRERGDLEAAPGARALLESFWKSVGREDLAGLSGHYRANESRNVVTALRLGSGYSLDWHNHLAAGCTATLLVYLFSAGTAGQGGELVLGELERDMQTVRETVRFQPKHGDAILIGDASHPLMMHKAEPWHGEGYRYLISFAFNADDW